MACTTSEPSLTFLTPDVLVPTLAPPLLP